MKKFLIFRTDRIGDFIASKIIFESIKSNNNKNTIDVICSNYNQSYLKKYNYINKLIVLDKQNLKNYFSNILKLIDTKYDYLIVLDGKRRSFIYSLFIRSRKKFIIVKNKNLKFLKNLFKYTEFLNSERYSQFKNFILSVGVIGAVV